MPNLKILIILMAFMVPGLTAQPPMQWLNRIDHKNGYGYLQVHDLTTDKLGNVYISGTFNDTIDFDPSAATHTLFSANMGDGFLLKLDQNGAFQWVKQFVTTTPSYNRSFSKILVDPSGNIYIAGHYKDLMDFDPGPGTHTLQAMDHASTASCSGSTPQEISSG
jgi:hypothetical protein